MNVPRMPLVWWVTLALSVGMVVWTALDEPALGFVLGAGIGCNRLLQLLLVARGEDFR